MEDGDAQVVDERMVKDEPKDDEASQHVSAEEDLKGRRRSEVTIETSDQSRRKRARSRSPEAKRTRSRSRGGRSKSRSRSRERRRHRRRHDSSSRSRSRSKERRDHKRKRSRSRDRSSKQKAKAGDSGEKEAPLDQNAQKKLDVLMGKTKPSLTGGVYIPPHKLRELQKDLNDKSSVEYQRITWDALKKSINGLINKINVSNIRNIVPELLAENIIRGRGLLARSLMKAQAASPSFTRVYAALVAVINSKMPTIGELILSRLLNQFVRSYRRNDKSVLISSTRFIAHLVNQRVAGDIVALQILALLIENPTDDSVEVAVNFVKECGMELSEMSSQAFNSVFERFRGILHEGEIDKRVQYMIENLFAIRKSGFAEHVNRIEDLDLVEEEDQITHEDLNLDGELNIDEEADYFRPDPDFVKNEAEYELIKKELLGEEEEGAAGEAGEEEEEEDDQAKIEKSLEAGDLTITDETDTNTINLRRTIYLTIMSSLDFEECVHKLMKIQLLPGQEIELCRMVIECCSQERTYLRFYGLMGQRLCMMDREHQARFDQCFVKQYQSIHRLETNKLRNVAKFFAHLLHSDALPWTVLEYIHLNEDETTSSSRIFIKILFQEISEYLGLAKLNERLKDPTMAEYFVGLFPKDHPKNTRFAINFFTSIGLGGLTDELREHLRTAPKRIMEQKQDVESDSSSSSSSESSSDSSDSSDSDSSSSDSDSSDSDSDSSDSSSSSSSSDSDSSDARRKRRRRK